MATTFGFWSDSGMTQSHSGTITTITGGDYLFYIGSTDATRQLEAQSNPGTDSIYVNIVDSDDQTGHSVSEVKLATTSAGLDSASAGVALNLGTSIAGGTAQAVYVRLTDGTGGGVASTDLSLDITDCYETLV